MTNVIKTKLIKNFIQHSFNNKPAVITKNNLYDIAMTWFKNGEEYTTKNNPSCVTVCPKHNTIAILYYNSSERMKETDISVISDEKLKEIEKFKLGTY